MHRCAYLVAVVFLAGCARVNVEEEQNALLAVDREWSQTMKEPDKFLSYFADDATIYAPGAPMVTGADARRQMITEMAAAPGFAMSWTATKAVVAGSADIGYTAGTYEMTTAGGTEKGKYVTTWKKENGTWKAVEDIFNADAAPASAASQHVMMAPGALKWGDPPPSLPPGSRLAVISGDPSQAQPFVIRAQVPAGYKVPPHWHPGVENLTILSGTVALGMGETFDEKAMTEIPVGGYASLPAGMRHSFLAKTAATFQVHGMGPFVVNYVNPADDPSKQQK
jgi:ketosteroid isomerase-like protein/quercetin dioxygenase-like cupin family protein